MLRVLSFLLSKKLKTSNIPKAKQFAWLESPIRYSSPRSAKSTPESELFQVKHPKINSKTRNRTPLLILQSFPCLFDISNLIIQARGLGFKSWVLKTHQKHGSQEEFELALNFIKEKTPVIAFGNWINLIQNSPNLDYALVVRPKFNLSVLNAASEEANKKKLRDLEIWKELQKQERLADPQPPLHLNSILPELECKKPILIYCNEKLDFCGNDLKYPVVYEKKSWIKMEPMGDKEVFLLKMILSLKGFVEGKGN
jgi:hypothetical protein